MQTKDFWEILFSTMQMWHYHIAKPFKHLLDDGISPEMYYSIQLLRRHDDMLAMSELAALTRMPKQQMTKTVNRLINYDFVERISDPTDRRIIRLHVTEKALRYLDTFFECQTEYYEDLLKRMSDEDKCKFTDALQSLNSVLGKLSEKQDCKSK